MRQGFVTGLGLYGLALSLSVAAVAPALGQDPRDACLAQAYKEFDTARRQELLTRCLNPSAGAPRGAWPLGVQLLAQTLIEDGQDSVAGAWLRWAVRLSPDLQPDTVQFLPRVVSAYRAARDFVIRTRSLGDTMVATTWLWPTQATGEKDGKLEVAASTPPLRVNVTGVGLVGQGGNVPLAPGSYQVAATAPGYDSVRVTREVVPGVTTLLQFHLRAPVETTRLVQRTQENQGLLRTDVPQAKGGIPAWMKLGAGAGVVWAILWNAYIKSH